MFNIILRVVLAVSIPYLAWYGIMAVRAELHAKRSWLPKFAPQDHLVLRLLLYTVTLAVTVVAVAAFLRSR